MARDRAVAEIYGTENSLACRVVHPCSAMAAAAL